MILIIGLIIGIYLAAVLGYRYVLKLSAREALFYATIGIFVSFALKIRDGWILYGEVMLDWWLVLALLTVYIFLAIPLYRKQKKKLKKINK